MKITKCNYKFPRLTKEEWKFFLKEEVFSKKLRNKYGLWRSLYRRIGQSLQTLAVAKLVGGYKGITRVNKKEALEHHLKACRYYPKNVFHSRFRKAVGLFPYKEPPVI